MGSQVQNILSMHLIFKDTSTHIALHFLKSSNKCLVLYFIRLIRLCLGWWACSPKTYEAWRDQGVLILPCASLLKQYKNCLQQTPGLHDDHLHWMKAEADRLKMKDAHRCGGIMFDEMSIQVLQVEKIYLYENVSPLQNMHKDMQCSL